MSRKPINEQISSLRKSAGLRRAELAKLIGVSRGTIYRWESGEIVPRADHYTRVVEVCESLMRNKS